MNDAVISPEKEPVPLPGVLVIPVPGFSDHRGVFEPVWDAETFASLGIPFRPESAAHSYNRRAGTIRAFHYQCAPFAQSKLVSCVAGSIWDVAVDLRPDSPAFGRWSAVHLSEACGNVHFIPAGCAHGFLTLTDASTVAYLIEGPYRPEAARTLRWNDPKIGVPWPIEDPILSEKDRNAPLLNPLQPTLPE
jgi:dTDP-4-dehydrorhamnose 3,5-epimerase